MVFNDNSVDTSIFDTCIINLANWPDNNSGAVQATKSDYKMYKRDISRLASDSL